MTARRASRIALGIAFGTALVCSSSLGAGAQTGGGDLGVGYVRATVADLGAGTFGGGGLPARAPAVVPPFTWARAATGSVCVVFAGAPPADLPGGVAAIPGPSRGFPLTPGPALGGPPGAVLVNRLAPLPPDAVIVGELVVEVGDDPNRANDIVVVPRCVRPGTPVLAAPPSAAEIWQQTPLPRAVVHASPPGTRAWPGITRLGTDFWGDAVSSATARVSLDSFDVDVVAWPIGYAWAFGNGANVVVGDPATRTRVAYPRRGDFEVTLFVVWEGRARLAVFGLDLGEQDLGTVTIPERVPYRVGEIRAVLRTPRGRN